MEHENVEEEDVYSRNSRLLWLRHAARTHVQIVSICRKLRQVCDNNFRNILGHIDANFDGLNTEEIILCILWLREHKLFLGQLRVRVDFPDITLICKVLQECDTNKVRPVQMYLGDMTYPKDSTNSRMINQAWNKKFPDSIAVDLTGENISVVSTKKKLLI